MLTSVASTLAPGALVEVTGSANVLEEWVELVCPGVCPPPPRLSGGEQQVLRTLVLGSLYLLEGLSPAARVSGPRRRERPVHLVQGVPGGCHNPALMLLPQEAFKGQEPDVHQADPVLAGQVCGCFGR